MANSWGQEFITTNPYGTPVKPVHIASGPSFGRIKEITDLERLYNACGKFVVTGMLLFGFIFSFTPFYSMKCIHVLLSPSEWAYYPFQGFN